MEKVEIIENGIGDIGCDKKSKELVRKELEYCRNTLKREYEKLYDYQLDYFCWVNTRKDVINSMKAKSLSDSRLEEIMNFCDTSNSFLVAKLKTIHSYISYIKNTISNFANVNDFVDIDSIDTKLRLMLFSLGMNLPSDIFGKPF